MLTDGARSGWCDQPHRHITLNCYGGKLFWSRDPKFMVDHALDGGSLHSLWRAYGPIGYVAVIGNQPCPWTRSHLHSDGPCPSQASFTAWSSCRHMRGNFPCWKPMWRYPMSQLLPHCLLNGSKVLSLSWARCTCLLLSYSMWQLCFQALSLSQILFGRKCPKGIRTFIPTLTLLKRFEGCLWSLIIIHYEFANWLQIASMLCCMEYHGLHKTLRKVITSISNKDSCVQAH